MKRNEPVSKIMSTGLITVHHGDPISKARKLLRDHGVHHIPVVNGHKIVGILSLSDILRVSFGDAFGADERAVDATLDHTMTHRADHEQNAARAEERCFHSRLG